MDEGVGGTLIALAFVFMPLSLLSFGGGGAILADMEQQAVVVHHWTDAREFADLFAISRAAPGPGTMLSALVGWKAAGWPGAVTAAAALYLPSSIFAILVARLWGRWRGSAWHAAIERGLAPIAAGLVLSGGLAVLRISTGGAAEWLATLAATAVLLRWPRLHPAALMCVLGALFGVIEGLRG